MLVMLFGLSVGLNYVWELAQSPLYTGVPIGVSAWWHCFVASLGDGVMVLIIETLGWLYFRHADWFVRAGWKEYGFMLGAGLLLAIGTELIAVHGLQRWGYSTRMPMVPWIDVAFVPLTQMLVLPPVVFWLTRNYLANKRHDS